MIKLKPEKGILLIVDVQEKLFPHVDRASSLVEKLKLLVSGAKLLEMPVIATEQYPKGLGPTIQPLKELIGEGAFYPAKTCFSSLGEEELRRHLFGAGREQFIVAGIEAHVCVLQTVRDLVELGKQVVVINDAISSRKAADLSSALAEMRDMGARLATTETVLFELLHDAKHPQFKAFSALIKC